MSITKLATNIKINVTNKYVAITSKLDKAAEEIKIDATKNNLIINCLKKINTTGEKSE